MILISSPTDRALPNLTASCLRARLAASKIGGKESAAGAKLPTSSRRTRSIT